MRYYGIFLVLSFLPFVQATILLEDLSQQTYNIGDRVILSGYLLEDKDVQGILQFDLSCRDLTPLLMKSVSVKKGEQFPLYEKLPLFFPSDRECTILASLLDQTTIIDHTESTSFFVTSDLSANFTLQNTLIQLGKPIEISGEIYKQNEKTVQGLAIFTFLHGENVIFIDTVEIKEGVLSYQKDSTGLLAGEYSLTIDVTEFLGNKQHFENVLRFTLVNEVPVFVEAVKDSVLPGGSLTLFGEANTILRDGVQDGEVTLYFDEEQITTDINDDGQFQFQVPVPEIISSGKHDLRVVIVDTYGNTGEATTSIDILPLPLSLDARFEKKVYLPGDSILFTPFLYDQTKGVIKELLRAQIIDSEKNVVDTFDVSSSLETTYTIPETALSGTWTLQLMSNSLTFTKEFFIGTLSSLDYTLTNGQLIVKNIGNMEHTLPLDIHIEGGHVDISLVKRTDIPPGESIIIYLNREVESGIYDVTIGNQTFEQVQITGSPSFFHFDTLYWIFLFVILFFFIYFLFFHRKRKILKHVKRLHGDTSIRKSPDEYIRDYEHKIMKNMKKRDRAIRKKLRFPLRKLRKRDDVVILGDDDFHHEKKEFFEEKKNDEENMFRMFD